MEHLDVHRDSGPVLRGCRGGKAWHLPIRGGTCQDTNFVDREIYHIDAILGTRSLDSRFASCFTRLA